MSLRRCMRRLKDGSEMHACRLGLNINSLRNNFQVMTQQIKDNTDILMIFDTNLHESFPINQFLMNSCSSQHCLHRNCNNGYIFLYVKEDTPSKLLSIERGLTEPFFVEINLCNKKNRLISCCYNQN